MLSLICVDGDKVIQTTTVDTKKKVLPKRKTTMMRYHFQNICMFAVPKLLLHKNNVSSNIKDKETTHNDIRVLSFDIVIGLARNKFSE